MNETSSSILEPLTGHILVVDDEEQNRELLRDLLEEQGHQVTEAEYGEQALARVKKAPPDVILLDVMMPGMDGYEVCRRLKANPETAPIPILLVTALKERSERLAGIEAGANDFISKPIDNQELLLRVRNAVYTRHLYNRAQESSEKAQKLEKEQRVLLEKTLLGSIKVLTDVLSLANPTAFSHVSRLKKYVGSIAKELGLANIWEFELAATYSLLGCIALPATILDKVYTGAVLEDSEREMYLEHPKIGSDLIKNIPRLENIAAMISAQQKKFQRSAPNSDWKKENRIALGGFILKVAHIFDQLLSTTLPTADLFQQVEFKLGRNVPEIIEALRNLEAGIERKVMISVSIDALDRTMVLAQDVRAKNGLLLVPEGQEVTFPVIARLRNHDKGIGVIQPIQVNTKSGSGAKK